MKGDIFNLREKKEKVSGHIKTT